MCSLSWRSSHRRSFDLYDYRWWQRAIICVDWCIRVSRKLTCSPQPHSCLRAVKALLSCLHQRRHTGLLSPLSCQTLTVGVFSFSTALSLHLTNPLYQLHHSQHHTDLHCATFSIFYDTFTHLPSPPTAAKLVTCRLRGTQNHFPISRPPRLILILSISPTPIFTFLTPTHFSLLPTFSPFTSSNKSSASTQLLQIFSDPLFAISPSSSSSPSSYPFTLHRCLCLSSLYILSLRFAFSPSPAAWIYYYLHNGALLIVYELPALRPNKAYFHKKPPFHFSSN